MAGFDERDSTCVDAPVPDYRGALATPVKGLRIGVLREFFDQGLDAGVGRLVRAAIAALEEQGASVREVSLPHLPLSVPTYYVVAPAECSSNLSRFDGARFGHRCESPRDLLDMYERSRGEGFGDEVKRRIMTGTYVLSAGYYDAYYLKAQKVRQLIAADFAHAFADVDVVIGPTTPTAAFEIGAKTSDPITMYLNDIYTIGANLAGLPAVSIPCGFVREGDRDLPAGMQLIGPHFAEARLLGVAHQYQAHDLLAPPDAAGLRSNAPWSGKPSSASRSTPSSRRGARSSRSSSTAYGAAPNTQANLVDLGYPGVLPVLNGEAVRMAVRFGLATGCHGPAALGLRAQELLLSGPAEGLPDQPVRAAGRRGRARSTSCSRTAAGKTIGITRAHLEEDAGKSLHEDFHGLSGIDLNRAGTPLLEIVSEPDLRSAKEAVAYMKKVHTLVRYLGICDGNMQEGSFRCDANVSVRPQGQATLGTRAEIKNLNSFRFVERAINHEVARQVGVARTRRQRRAGDAPVRSGPQRDARDALEGGSERLSLLPRSGPAAARDRRRADRAGPRLAPGAARTRRPRGSAATSSSPPTTRAC